MNRVHRSVQTTCPRCRLPTLEPGTIAECRQCHGHWIPEDVLADRVHRMRPSRPPGLVWTAEQRPALPCAICGDRMATLRLWKIPVDRCNQHGYWFDPGELMVVLLRSTRPTDPAAPLGPIGMLGPAPSEKPPIVIGPAETGAGVEIVIELLAWLTLGLWS